MMDAAQTEGPPIAGLVLPWKALGFYLRRQRVRMGFSLRELEWRSGVSDSIILQIESGRQDCKLESFVRICGALGVSPGHVLDFVSAVDCEPYLDKIASSKSVINATVKYEQSREFIVANLAMVALFVSHLVRCSRPLERAKSVKYPFPKLKGGVVKFAELLEREVSPSERVSILEALVSDPIGELTRFGLFDSSFVAEFAEFSETSRDTDDRHLGSLIEEGFSKPLHVFHWMPFPSEF
jgi:transcriptional regulator with XRE-family HTH domain